MGAIAGLTTDSDNRKGPNLIKSMRDNGAITDAVFAFYLESTEGSSYLDIGSIDESAMRDPENLFMIDILYQNYWWAQTIVGIRFGDEEADSYGLHGEKAITDSGTSCIIVPDRYYDWILERLRYDFDMTYTSTNTQNIYLDTCLQIRSLPKISLLFGGYWFEADASDYVVRRGSECYLCLSRGGDMWILGDAFLRGYYAVHNLDTL